MVYSKERRQEVLALAAQGVGTREIALRCNCSESWVRRVKQEHRETGKIAPQTHRTRTAKWVPIADRIQQAIEANPDQTLQELKDTLNTPLGRSTLCRALRAMKLTLKKKS
jgi:transposase